jgi:tetrapyrrole methylase family protein/MazG family protein
MNTVYLVGLGPGDPQALTVGTLKLLLRAEKVYVRAAEHPALLMLDRHGIAYRTLDSIYRQAPSFEQAYRQMAGLVLNAARHCRTVAYLVPGSPACAERSVEIIRALAPLAGVCCRTLPAVSFVEAMVDELALPGGEKPVVLDAFQPDRLLDYPDRHLLVMQAYSRQMASLIKLELLKLYPPEHPVTVIRAAGLLSGKIKEVRPLCEIDHLQFIDHLTTFYLPPLFERGVQDLLRVMRRLRGEGPVSADGLPSGNRKAGGCPWDMEQDHHTLKPYLLEETYEVLNAIDSADLPALCEELGDLLLQIVFHCQIAAENGSFSFYDAVAGITEKLVRRHPHVFSGAASVSAAEVTKSWQQIKQSEKAGQESCFVLPSGFPALLGAQKLQRQAASVGFDWPEVSGAWDKVEEELQELHDAYREADRAKIVEEMGDVLFALVNLSRFLDVDAEQALAAGTGKFYRCLCYVEKMAKDEGREMADFPLSVLDEWWRSAKSYI